MLSDRIVVQITARPGETFLDRMIALVEGAARQKTPNEIALNILLASLTIVFLLAVVTLQPLATYSRAPQSMIVLVSLLVCLIPTTIGALLSAIGIAGMDRLVQRNVLAMSGRAVEAAGDVNTLLLDKTGTITLGNREAAEFLPAGRGATPPSWPTPRSWPAWPTRPPRAARSSSWPRPRYGLRERRPGELTHATFVPFTATTRMSGADLDEDGAPHQVRKGAASAVRDWVRGVRRRAAGRPRPDGRRDRRLRRHPAGRRRQRSGRAAGARRGAPEGHRQGRACASGSPSCAAWASAP